MTERWPRLGRAPRFEADLVPAPGRPEIGVTPWSGHRRFAYDLVRWLRPERVIDLGVHWGCSTFAFAQAAKDTGQACEIIGVDTFVGDDHAGFYGEEVFEYVSRCAAELFSGTRLRIERRTFDEALPLVPDRSTTIIHIDGRHDYEDVRHDFESWLPKLAPDGLMLFHDVGPGAGYGSERFWQEIAGSHPSMRFTHSWGLGLLFPRGDALYRRLVAAGFPELLERYRRADQVRQLVEARRRGAAWSPAKQALLRRLRRLLRSEGQDPVERARYRLRASAAARCWRRFGSGEPARIAVLGEDAARQQWELRRRWLDAEVEVAGATEGLSAAGGGFDLVASFAAIEREPDPLRSLEAVRAGLRPAGILVVTSPTPYWLARSWRSGNEDLPPTLGRDAFVRACAGAGLEVVCDARVMSAVGVELCRRGILARVERLEPLEVALGRVPLLRRTLVNSLFVARRPAG